MSVILARNAFAPRTGILSIQSHASHPIALLFRHFADINLVPAVDLNAVSSNWEFTLRNTYFQTNLPLFKLAKFSDKKAEVTCEHNGQTYKKGDRIAVDPNKPCKKCVCTENWNPSSPRPCFTAFCSPIPRGCHYRPGTCCGFDCSNWVYLLLLFYR